jgi:glycosyltransferase involved in cell wall biosynthesis
MAPSLSVVICSLNGAEGVQRCLRALDMQSIRPALELIVVDDGSTDCTSQVARAHGAVVIRHASNRGASAARNSGIDVASAPVVAFLDDDCEPSPHWAEALLASYDANVIAVGGPLTPGCGSGIIAGYIARHNPIRPQERELAASSNLIYRFWLYVMRQWRPLAPVHRRQVVAMPSANISVRRRALLDAGGFDERIRFGGEDDDLCKRLSIGFPDMQLIVEPEAWAVHHFKASLPDTMRRSRVYGRASAVMFCKWPDIRPTVFPFPVFVFAMLLASCWFPVFLAAATLLPHVLYPQGLRDALARRRLVALLDPYLQLLQEASENYGFVRGWWHFRKSFAQDPPVNRFRHQLDAMTDPEAR